jgi:hypothetical protein
MRQSCVNGCPPIEIGLLRRSTAVVTSASPMIRPGSRADLPKALRVV